MGTRHMPGSGIRWTGPVDAMLSCHVVAGCSFGRTGTWRTITTEAGARLGTLMHAILSSRFHIQILLFLTRTNRRRR